MKWFERGPEGVTLHIPLSGGGEVALWLAAIGALFVAASWALRVQAWRALPKLTQRHEGLNAALWAVIAPFALAMVVGGVAILMRFLTISFGTVGAGEFGEWSGSARNIALALGAAFGAPFVVFRLVLAQRQADASERGQIAGRLKDALASLGARHADNSPNIEARVGGIFALESVSRISEADHIGIMGTLCAYIKLNAPARHLPESPRALWRRNRKSGADGKPAREGEPSVASLAAWAGNLRPPTHDIEAALDVFARRSADRIRLEKGARLRGVQVPFRVDLRNTSLQSADLSRFNAEGGFFHGARMEGSILDYAELAECFLHNARLECARMLGCDLSRARLIEAYLDGASLKSANCSHALFTGSSLNDADFERADLGGGIFQRCELNPGTKFNEADLSGALFQDIDFSGCDIQSRQLATAFGDGSVKLDGLDRPTHWPDGTLPSQELLVEYRQWQADPASYLPPQNRP